MVDGGTPKPNGGRNIFRVFFEKAFDAFFLLDLVPTGEEFLIIEANSSALKMFGCSKRSEFIGKTIFDFSPELQADGEPSEVKGFRNFEKALKGEPQNFEWLHTRLDGTPFIVEVSLSRTHVEGRPMGIAVVRDITQRKDAEQENILLQSQMHQSQRIEALGTLAGGIAHDFNNILSVIIGFTELAVARTARDDPARKDLDTALTACTRAADLVRRILTFSRQTRTERKPILIEPIVTESIEMMRAILPKSLTIQADLDAPDAVVHANPIEIHQVVMNLCTNAGQAIGDYHGEISIRLCELSPTSAANMGWLELAIEDTGTGMSKETLSKVFDPYFTTKPIGKGTGLGLSVVHGIAKSLGGTVDIESELGNGTIVYFRISMCEEKETSEQKSQRCGTGNGEQVLVVDDECELAEFMTQALELHGYEVLSTTSGAEALELVRSNASTIRLVLTDLSMPVLTGLELAKMIGETIPHLPVILCTGNLTVEQEKQAAELGVREILHKPIGLNTFISTVKTVLESQRAQ